jgi:hypothetical protein
MAARRMHSDEVDTDVSLVGRFPIRLVPSWGTDNALYRLGDDMVVRLPPRERTARTRADHHRAEGGPTSHGLRAPPRWNICISGAF